MRGPSQTHAVQVLEHLAKGARLEDIAQIMFSLDACPPEVDRCASVSTGKLWVPSSAR